uniref:Protein kinase domain-containing protein n=1 Tax=Ciona savignyi TaxID=51511 RepID=H2ZC95_CIOSA
MWQLNQAVSYLHDTLKLIHGDLRPENILMLSISRCTVKLCNFRKAHTIGSCVKMNSRRGNLCADQLSTWRHHLRHITSFLRKRRPSFTIGKVEPSEESEDCEMGSGSLSTSDERSSSMRGNTNCSSELHEYTLGDMKRELNSELFSRAFTAPELVNATRYIASPASDNWSLAILAIYCVTGSTPWEIASVDNTKYTNFLHCAQKSQTLTPTPVEISRPNIRRFLKIRSASLTSLVGFSVKRRTRTMTPAFEKRVTEVLQQTADKGVDRGFGRYPTEL